MIEPISTFTITEHQQMDGKSLERTLTSSSLNRLTLVLFYASWCPFSYEIQSKFGVLAAMFPQIRHVMVEESSVLPIVFSRYGIHSLPSILMVNQTGIVRYYGPKDLPSLLQFYKSTAGLDPVVDMTKVQLSHYEETGSRVFQLWNQKPLKDIFIKEPYLILSLMFIFYKASIYLIPLLVCRVKALWFALVPHLSVGVLGESKQLLRRVFHGMDLKRIGNKVNTGSRSIGTQTARVWASSLASV
ncbi:5'-adenylylsulfate reductase-like 7 isoform X2 [Apium graveolens]|uniref:5'-adenylylsulfate reductase-like 7 isoform X2 n=1 Tax=Apium graveolens TaxID=4045 RepID=UPI003D7C0C93